MNNEQHIPIEQLEEIERFLQHQMPPAERDAFQARLEADADLRKMTSEYELMFLGIQEASLEARLDDFHKGTSVEQPVGTTPGKAIKMNRWLVAASVLVIMAASAWWLFSKGNKQDALYADFFQADPGLITTMGSTDNYSFDRAMVDYKTGNYYAAIRIWDSLHTMQPDNDTLNYFLGSAYLASKETGKAIPFLQKVKAGSSFAKEADWYLGLALLKEGRIKESAPLLQQSGHPQSKALLTRLNNEGLIK